MVIKRILAFCERYERLSTRIAFFIIALQLVHLFWLTTDVVFVKAFGLQGMFPPALEPIQAVIDYTEIPGLFAAIAVYVMNIARGNRGSLKNSLFIAMLLLQVIHLFWITDEVVYETFFNSNLIDLPEYVAWVAILIDYLELPVIADLFIRAFRDGKKGKK
jgi:hypothetical protein